LKKLFSKTFLILQDNMLIYFLPFILLAADENCSADKKCSDLVEKVPEWGDEYKGTMYSGYVSINPDCNSYMFYWFLEKDGGSDSDTPVLLWLNGGPGASSIDGLLTENIGPYQVNDAGNGFKYNEHAWTDMYNVLIIDNPVGTGYSKTDNKTGCYVTNEAEVAAQFYIALDAFFGTLHPEYKSNPFFLIGESYAGKYIPNIAQYLDEQKFPFVGVILGNGLFLPQLQYMLLPEFAWSFGLIDKNTKKDMSLLALECVSLIEQELMVDAMEFCEGFSDEMYRIAGNIWRYDVRYVYDPTVVPDSYLSTYLNSEKVQIALHTTGTTWTDADETGPVSDALKPDFMVPCMDQLEYLVSQGYQVTLYNGQMDGSTCNHIGNAVIAEKIKWDGQTEFKASKQSLWRQNDTHAIGYKRVYKNLAYVLITDAGHMVPLTQPDNFRFFLDTAVNGTL